ncbi:MAG: hypothetical protein HY240_04595 [Actinobacteria bacterium]|nr:hypothetical protein [Actinomycetota bacterium]
MDGQRNHKPALRGHRRIGVVVAGALVLALGATGVHAAFGDRTAAGPVTQPSPTLSGSHPAPHLPTPTVEPTPTDPSALADGIYPTYVVDVDVRGATVTVDVIQTFFGAAAHQAATQDGVPWKDVRYYPVYIRNENDLLRTLPVDRDVRVKLLGECVAPSRTVGLRELREVAIPFTEPSDYYYEVSVADGSIVGITQKVAVSGC